MIKIDTPIPTPINLRKIAPCFRDAIGEIALGWVDDDWQTDEEEPDETEA